MNLISCEKLEKSMVELQFSIDAETFKAAVNNAFKREGKKYAIPGFRKGKAPRHMIEKMYGSDIFHYDAVNDLFPEAYEAAVKEAKIDVVGRPDPEVVSMSEADGVVLKVKVAVKPEEYQAEELAGKDATFKIKLHEVKYKELPALDDDFAKDVSEYDTLDELKDSIRNNIKTNLDKQAEQKVENDLMDQVIANMKADIPDAMVDSRIDELVQDFEYRISQQGLKLADYLKYMGMNIEQFRAQFKEQADKQVKMRLAMEAIVAKEGITASDEEFEEEVKRIADAYKMEADKVKSIVDAAAVKADLAINKAIDFVKEKANVVTAEPKEEEKQD